MPILTNVIDALTVLKLVKYYREEGEKERKSRREALLSVAKPC